MASGEIHSSYIQKGWSVVIPLGIVYTGFLYVYGVKYFYLYPIFFYMNYSLCDVFNPDNDLISITSGEGIILRTTKKYWLGFLGALLVSYGFLYSYLIGLVGGHRSKFSHSMILGTLGRMIFYNFPGYIFLLNFYSYGIRNWGWTLTIGLYESCKMEIWLAPYLISQFLAWSIGDGIHLILDSEWAKGKLYTPTKRK
jgi:hypothetical protein